RPFRDPGGSRALRPGSQPGRLTEPAGASGRGPVALPCVVFTLRADTLPSRLLPTLFTKRPYGRAVTQATTGQRPFGGREAVDDLAERSLHQFTLAGPPPHGMRVTCSTRERDLDREPPAVTPEAPALSGPGAGATVPIGPGLPQTGGR